ncbi:alpha/beta hydrolase [Candidatus Aquiluna sp. UB-MaderosW2red]|uniref:alpha/beta hydrolase n=1 Tax=Candidatus Aquiluna sp. UB-MaderosW2red TaxID=1855377 RepID=UPI000875B454|nr:alpha/beta hydrolase [Candidatus Aquiluna sp. UB-MaderosW2red]SCX08811.1 Acetyl esterase/lipase [Candidatus Aquiluna sp. UB-MaderosW2red]
MNFETVDPEILLKLKRFPNFSFSSKSATRGFRFLSLVTAKRVRVPKGIEIKNHKIGNKHVRAILPSTLKSDGAIIWIHGGGMIAGRSKDADALFIELAQEFGIAVFSLEYRLAPEHPYPAGLIDCEVGYKWVCANAGRFGFDLNKIVLGGDSAGAGLAVSLNLKLLSQKDLLPLGQLLKYPMLDDRTAMNRALDDKNFVWNNSSNYFAWKSYLAAEPGSKGDFGFAVPGRVQDLAGLPATWIGVGDIDLFFQENFNFFERLSEQGVPVSFNKYPGFPHAGELVNPEARVSKKMAIDFKSWLRNLLG